MTLVGAFGTKESKTGTDLGLQLGYDTECLSAVQSRHRELAITDQQA
jgi:hypothetical protein